MGTFAFAPSPMTGHVNPTLPIAARLVADGHEVTFHLPEEYGAQVRAVGARLAPITLDMGGPHTRTDDPVARFALVPAWLAGETGRVLPQLLAAFGDTRPDVIVYDMTCVWGKVLARLRPGRTAMVVGSYVGNEHFSPMRTPHYRAMAGHLETAFAHIGPAVAGLNARYALNLHPRELFARDEELVIVVMPRAFHPAGETFDDRYLFVGACLRDEPAPAWDAGLEGLDPTRPSLLVSAGTVLSLWPELVAACYEAFGDTDWQVVFAVGGAEVPAAPANILVRRAVPQLRLLSTVDAFVTHGGTNSVMEALHAAVPMVAVARAPEHAITADRIAELGLGVRLDPAALTAQELREAVEEVTGSAPVHRRLSAMREDVRAAGGAAAAAAALGRMLAPVRG